MDKYDIAEDIRDGQKFMDKMLTMFYRTFYIVQTLSVMITKFNDKCEDALNSTDRYHDGRDHSELENGNC